ncbi:diphthine--ammonia ligase [Anaerobacillus sp. CMMVII]|uniref:Dph6-related ATP pyrophosphatase n=1 Tax=Anaerobacillus sp. CMMVII TaxID=2755588 RepID=UPI0021B79AD8|nr:diphthine--ammonia ligase [Anaerobacillus sp. CMMVII]MCT8137069.1 diphthine--ammonia ligase [Anaerobacillus sp. CMMVII]
MKERAAVSWSGGKDSTFALYKILKADQYKVEALLTTVTEGFNRISIHGVRESLLEKQAESLAIPLKKMYIPQESSNEVYQKRMSEQLKELKNVGIETIVFGDIFLEDVRAYREELIEKLKMKAIFPLWGQSTDELINEFFSVGFKTITTCIDTEKVTSEFLGREMDEHFIKELPKNVDPCGENGEFHTFTFEGPLFKQKIDFRIGEWVERGRFHFRDLVG